MSRILMDAVDRGRGDDRRDGELLASERLGWFGAPGFEHRQGEPIRLAALSPACGLHARRALDEAGRLDRGVSGRRLLRRHGGGIGQPRRRAILEQGCAARHGRYRGSLSQPALPPSDVVLHTTVSDHGRGLRCVRSSRRSGIVVARNRARTSCTECRQDHAEAPPSRCDKRRTDRKGSRWKSRKRPRRTAATAWQCSKTGAGEGIRTLDPNLGKVVLYP